MKDFETLFSRIKLCTKCGISNTRDKVVVGKGSINPKILGVGEAPGFDENKTGEPFSGKAGKLFDVWLDWIGLDWNDFAVVNVLKCWPKRLNRSIGEGRNRKPTDYEILNCIPWLREQIRLLDPKIVVTIGSVATMQFLGNKYERGIKNYSGQFYKTRKGNLVYPIIHPAYFLRNGDEDWREQLEELKGYVGNDFGFVRERENDPKKKKNRNREEQNFVHLHAHTTYSFLDGFGTPERIASRYSDLGFRSAAITDHGTISGILKFSKECKKLDIKPIFGCEFYIVEDMHHKGKKGDKDDSGYEPKKRYHITVLAKNAVGYDNLLKLVTKSNLEGFYYKPRLDYKTLADYKSGLVVFSGCLVSQTSRLILDGRLNDAEKLILNMAKSYDDFYLEIMPHPIKDEGRFLQKLVNEKMFEFSSKFGLSLVATNDNHYILPEDRTVQEIMMAIGTNKKMSDVGRMKFDESSSFHIKTRREMFEEFISLHGKECSFKIEEALNNTNIISDFCNVEIKTSNDLLPTFVIPDSFSNQEEYFTTLCLEGARRRKIPKEKIYQDRFSYEIGIIKEKKFVNYFLIVWDLINYAKKNGIGCGPARGSSAGSLLSYCLGITEIDPIKYGLYFERFISLNRKDFPDIDMDFEDNRREDLKDYLFDKYGKDKVATIGTFGTFGGKGSLKDVARVMSVSLEETQKICDLVIERNSADARASFTLKDTVKEFEEAKEYAKKYPNVIKHAERLEGNMRQGGIHAAGVIVSKKPLEEFVSTEIRKGKRVVSFDGEDCEEIGFLKLDILGLKTISIIQDTFRSIEKNKGIKISMFGEGGEIPLDDKNVFEDLSKGNCECVFQFNTPHLARLCRDFKVENFEELSHINACSRPGVLQSGATLLRQHIKHGMKDKMSFDDEKLDEYYGELTKDTYVILYQEQVMQSVRDIGGFDWDETSYIRKGMSKAKGQEYFNKLEKKFIENAVENFGAGKVAAQNFWSNLCTFGAWGFNKAHSISYTYISYVCCWLKLNYTEEFILSCLVHESNEEKIFNILGEAKRLGIEIVKPDVNFSDVNFSIEDGKIIGGLIRIKHVGKNSAEFISSKKPFSDIDDFFKKIPKKFCNKRVVEMLLRSGALSSFGINRKVFLDNLTVICENRSIPNNIKELLYTDGEGFSEEELYFMEREILPFPSKFDPFQFYGDLVERFSFLDRTEMGTLDYEKSAKRVGLFGFIHGINVRSKARGRKVVRGGEEEFLKNKSEEIVKFCVIGFVIQNSGSKQCIIPVELYDKVKDWLSDAAKKRFPLVAVGSKSANSPFVSIRAISMMRDLNEKLINGDSLDENEKFLFFPVDRIAPDIKFGKAFMSKYHREKRTEVTLTMQLVSKKELYKNRSNELYAFCEFEDKKNLFDVIIISKLWIGKRYGIRLKIGDAYRIRISVGAKALNELKTGIPVVNKTFDLIEIEEDLTKLEDLTIL